MLLMEVFLSYNWWAIIVASLIAFVIGWPWYGPLFGKAWLDALGKTADEIQPSPKPFIISLVTTLITSITMAMLVSALEITVWWDGAFLGAVLGVGFIVASNVSDAAFCGWRWKLVVIQSGYRLVYAIIMGGIIGGWHL